MEGEVAGEGGGKQMGKRRGEEVSVRGRRRTKRVTNQNRWRRKIEDEKEV